MARTCSTITSSASSTLRATSPSRSPPPRPPGRGPRRRCRAARRAGGRRRPAACPRRVGSLGRSTPSRRTPARHRGPPIAPYLRCRVRCLFISNMVAFFAPNTASSFSSARISRRSSGFCRSFS
jgi:hypothetical protein